MPRADLAVRLPNWIGDCVMALPALQALASRGLRLHAFGRGWAPALLAGCSFPVTGLPAAKGLHPRLLSASGACRALLLTHSLSTARMLRQAGLPALGYDRDGRGPWLRYRLHWPREVHEARRYWLLAEAARRWCVPGSLPLERDPPPCDLPLAPGAAAQAAARWQQAGLPATSVLLCPVATGTVGGQSKHWPHFPELARRLQAQGRPLAVVAPPGLAAETAARYPGAPVLGEMPIAVFAAILARAAVVISNDSGPMHLAAAVGTPAVVPFGVTRPGRTGAWSPQLVAVQADTGWPPVEAVLQAVAGC